MSTDEDQQRQDYGQREISDSAANVGDRNSGQAEDGSANEAGVDETPSTEDHERDAGLQNDEHGRKKLGMGNNNASD